jgi:hypothetical protein
MTETKKNRLPQATKNVPLWKYDPEEDIIDPEEVVALLAVTKRNPPWQRAGGYGRYGGWKGPQLESFAGNFINGDTDTDILNVDLVASLKYAHEKGCQQTIHYYSKWIEEGYTEASIDAHHQFSGIGAFKDNKSPATFEGETLFWNDFSDDDQREINQKCVRHRKLRKCLYADAVKLFDVKNSAVPANKWQKFMAGQTKAIDWVSDRTEPAQSTPPDEEDRGVYYSFWHLAFTPAQCDKEKHTEVLSKLVMCMAKNFVADLNLRQTHTIPYFESMNDIPRNTQIKMDVILEEMKKEADAIFAQAQIKAAMKAQKTKKPQKMVVGKSINSAGLQLIWGLVQYVKLAAGYDTIDGVRFHNWWTANHAAMSLQSEDVAEKFFEAGSYNHWVNRISDGMSLRKVLAIWAEAFKRSAPDLKAKGIIKQRPKKRKGRFTMTKKIRSLILNNMMDINGEKRGVVDFLLGNLVGGHGISDAKGGGTNQGNCLPEPAADNSRHGKTNVPPSLLEGLPIANHLDREIFEQEEEPANRNEKII